MTENYPVFMSSVMENSLFSGKSCFSMMMIYFTQRKTMSPLNEKHVIINRHFLYLYVFILPCQYSYLNNVNLWELLPPNFNAVTETLNPKYADLTKLQLQPQQTRPVRKDLAT